MSEWLGVTGAIKIINNGIDKSNIKTQLDNYLKEATKVFTSSCETTFEWELVNNTDCASYTLVINANIIDTEIDYQNLVNIAIWLNLYLSSDIEHENNIDFLGLVARGIINLENGEKNVSFRYNDSKSCWKIIL